jgi:hypothetical protein
MRGPLISNGVLLPMLLDAAAHGVQAENLRSAPCSSPGRNEWLTIFKISLVRQE